MFATLDLIKAQPELAQFQFRATNRWIDGSHNRSTIKGFYAAGGEDATRAEEFQIDAGEPAITGDMDVRGALGVDDEPRNGFERIDVAFRVTGNAPEEKLREIVERAQKRSAVYDMVTNGVPVSVQVTSD